MKATVLEKSDKLKLLETRCRDEGLPVTVQRRAVLAALLARDDHPTADQIYDAVRDAIPGVSRTTVYRVLVTLIELGIARKIRHSEAFARFDGNTDHHHHLVCLRCAKVVDFHDPAIGKLPGVDLSQSGFEIVDFSVYVEGICADCRRVKKPRPFAKNEKKRTR